MEECVKETRKIENIELSMNNQPVFDISKWNQGVVEAEVYMQLSWTKLYYM